MTPASDIRAVFSKALEVPPAAREAFLAELPEAVRAEVESLLSAYESAGQFLERPEDAESLAGEHFGPYRIIEKIGEGGMGVVYRAVRDDGEFQREVAIKLVGGRLFAPEAERRFIAERRILALLDHPNIVHMIDGGVSNRQRYLVMELVAGQPVTEYCAERALSIPERLRLFQAICSAIQYAHQRLIIHRDLKAQNILVTPEGNVKVLDFGIARLLEADSGGDANSTMLHPLTLSCASPEQVRDEPLTLASDIYALGLLLYELLTGKNPQGAGTRTEMVQRIVESDPAPPSKQAASVSTDLDAVVLKALAKEPSRRYASAQEMLADIGRYLEKRPVLARPPSRLYAAARFCARNKGLTASAAALILAVLTGLAAFSWQARRADRQRVIAERRFDEARRLLYTVIHEIQPKLASVNGTVSIRQELIEKTLVYLEALSKDAGDNRALTRELIDSYLQLASVTGDVSGPSSGDRQRASEILRKAETLANGLSRSTSLDPASLRTLSRFYQAATNDASNYGEGDRAREYARRDLDVAQRLMNLAPGETTSAEVLALSLYHLASVSSHAEQVTLFQRCLTIWQDSYKRQPSDRALRNIALMYKNLAGAFADSGDFKQSLEIALKAYEIDEKRLAGAPTSPLTQMDLAFDVGAVGWAYYNLHDYARAAESMRQNVALREKVAAANPDDRRAADRLAYALRDLVMSEKAIGDEAAAHRDLVHTLEIYTRLAKRSPLNTQSLVRFAETSHDLGIIEQQSGRENEACRYFENALNLLAHREGVDEEGGANELKSIRKDAAGCVRGASAEVRR